MKIWRGLAVALTGALLFTGCTPAGGRIPGTLAIEVAFYPFQFVAERVGGDAVTVRNLTAPGTEPHDLELAPQQVASLAEADLVVFQSGFQPAVDAAVAQAKPARVVDSAAFLTLLTGSADGEEHTASGATGTDPHTWLDPTNLAAVAEHVRDALSAADPARAEQFASNTRKLVEELTTLDTTIKADLTGCRVKPFITSHAAFGYFAARYGLTQVGIRGLEPDVEPSAARIAAVQKIARDNGVTTIFFETLVSPVVAQSVAGDLGLKTDVLDPLEGITPESRGTDYLEVMRSNANSLKVANQCS